MDPVRHQRATLCDLLESLTDEQWAAETMCGGWDAGDIAAHLLVRERETWAAGGVVFPPLAGLTASRMAKRKARGRAAMIGRLRSGPPRLAQYGIFGRVQVGEDYIHTEDVRRGGAAALEGTADLTPDDGTGDAAIDELLWQAVGRFALQAFGGVDVAGVLGMTDGVRTRAYQLGGRFPRPAADGQADATVSGTAGELLLWTTARASADVALNGDPDLVGALGGKGRRV